MNSASSQTTHFYSVAINVSSFGTKYNRILLFMYGLYLIVQEKSAKFHKLISFLKGISQIEGDTVLMCSSLIFPIEMKM